VRKAHPHREHAVEVVGPAAKVETVDECSVQCDKGAKGHEAAATVVRVAHVDYACGGGGCGNG
jgi:hypothetical protein